MRVGKLILYDFISFSIFAFFVLSNLPIQNKDFIWWANYSRSRAASLMKPNYVTEKTHLFWLGRGRSFLFSSCILYTFVVNIITLSGTHHKKEPLSQSRSAKSSFSGICSFLYILDMSTFFRKVITKKMYKKCTFYTYA